MNSTVRSLLQRGFDSELAERLHRDGYTLARLRSLKPGELKKLGVPSDYHDAFDERRPPIPPDTVFDLLRRNADTCCICRDARRGVVIHHIVEWSESGSHEEENLAVLCLLCHDKAHTVRQLTRNLTAQEIRHHKRAWQREVKRRATKALFTPNATSLGDGFWDYFNRARLMDLANSLRVDLRSLPGYATLPTIDESQLLARHFRWEGTIRVGKDNEYEFFKAILRAICEKSDWIDLDQIWTRGEVRSLVRPNTLVALTANHRFRSYRRSARGPGQTRNGQYTRQGIRLEFNIDAWECTSHSSYTNNLTGSWICTSLCLVRSVVQSDRSLTINGTCLAIGTGFTQYEGRTPVVAYTHGGLGEEVEDED